MLTIAPYCHEESRKAGATPAQIKAGIALVEQAMVSLEGINAQKIEVTIAEGFHPWWRRKAPKHDCRAIVEISPASATLHVVLPRESTTYYRVEELWLKYRSVE